VGFSLGSILRVGGYFAVTTNTAQVGAHVDLRISAYSFTITGYLAFDALFHFDPFRFTVEIGAGVSLKRGSTTLFEIDLSGSLAGPSPWHLHGKAKFKIWPLSFDVNVDETFGPSESPPPIPPADVFGQLVAAVGDERNWAAQIPRERYSFVTLREIGNEDGDVLTHPLGVIGVRQRVVPLNVSIERFGNARPARYTRFDIASVSVQSGTITLEGDDLKEKFAPAQYLDLTESEKLSRPSFESYNAGWAGRLPEDKWLDFAGKGREPTESDLVAEATLNYENKTIDSEVVVSAPGDSGSERRAVPAETAIALSRAGAVATGPLRRTGRAKFAGPNQQVTFNETRYVVARAHDLVRVSLEEIPAEGTTYVEATQAMEAYQMRHPAETASLQVIGAHELAELDGGGT
jgi:hypothetical protein